MSDSPGEGIRPVGDPSAPVMSGPLGPEGPATAFDSAGFLPWSGSGHSSVPHVPPSDGRWSIALGRFGTFEKLYTTTSRVDRGFRRTRPHSASKEPSTTSSRIAFSAVEEYGNTPSPAYAPAGFAKLRAAEHVAEDGARKDYD